MLPNDGKKSVFYYAELQRQALATKRTPLFFDFEFTGLVQNTTPISLGIASLDGAEFYAEFNDYKREMVDEWIAENVIKNLVFPYPVSSALKSSSNRYVHIKSDTAAVSKSLRMWLSQFDKVEFWGDCLAYDWVLLCELFGGARFIPKNVYYIPFDICTLFRTKGIDPDVSRTDFVGDVSFVRHNALDDAKTIMGCWERMIQNPFL